MNNASTPVGVIYAVERPDLMQVYVGQSTNLKRRISQHRKANRCGLFSGQEPVVVVIGTCPAGPSLSLMEKQTAQAYDSLGWDVVSRNTRRVGFTALGSIAAAKSQTPEGRSAIGAAAKKRLAELSPEQFAERMQRLIGSITPESRREAGSRRRARVSPESLRQHGLRLAYTAVRRRKQCLDCGHVCQPGPMGMHQKHSGHSGCIELPPIDG